LRQGRKWDFGKYVLVNPVRGAATLPCLYNKDYTLVYEISESNNNRISIVGKADSFEAAKAIVEAMGVAFGEDDATFPDCYDAYMNDRRVLSVQPVGFKISEKD
jgi:hypothetical protein